MLAGVTRTYLTIQLKDPQSRVNIDSAMDFPDGLKNSRGQCRETNKLFLIRYIFYTMPDGCLGSSKFFKAKVFT